MDSTMYVSSDIHSRREYTASELSLVLQLRAAMDAIRIVDEQAQRSADFYRGKIKSLEFNLDEMTKRNTKLHEKIEKLEGEVKTTARRTKKAMEG